MQLFYSGAVNESSIQNDPTISLGGFISSTPIPNGGLNNLFPPISREGVKSTVGATRLIVLRNGPIAITGLKIFTLAGPLSSYKIGASAPAIDTKGRKLFEILSQSDSFPYQAELLDHETEDQSIMIPNLQPDQIIGMWIRRELKTDAFTQLDGAPITVHIPCSDLQALLENSEQNLFDQGQLVIKWD